MVNGKPPKPLEFVVFLLQWFLAIIAQGISLKDNMESLGNHNSIYEYGERERKDKSYGFSLSKDEHAKLSQNSPCTLLGFSHVVVADWNGLGLVQIELA